MPAPTITPLPAAPSRSTDPATFAIEADAFVGALPVFGTEANAQADYLDALAIAVDADAQIVELLANANWVGPYSAIATYQIGDAVTYLGGVYIANTINTGITPTDGINWYYVSRGEVSLASVQTLTNKTFGNYTETVFAVVDGATVNLDPNNGPIQTWTLGASRTPGQVNWAAGQSITLMIDDGTSYTVNWATLGVVWKTNAAVAPTLVGSGFTVIVLWKVNATIYGARVGDA